MAEDEGMEYELVPISPLHKIKREIEEIKKMKQSLPVEELHESIKNLVVYLDKSGRVNQELLAKMTELMIRVTALTARVDSLVSAIGGAPAQAKPAAQMPEAMPGETPEEKMAGIRNLVQQNVELTKTLRGLEGQLKKESVREAVKRAIEQSVSR